jgi:type II secretory pathway pseudopilin PulG
LRSYAINRNSNGKKAMQRMTQFGFTLFEIAFAIVIICLLATVMVMGQNLAVDSQVARLERDFRSIQTAIYDSQDEGRKKHGDVRRVSFNLQDSAASGTAGDLNGMIDGNWNSASGEFFQLWKNVRPAVSAQGSTDKHALALLKLPGGVIAVSETRNEPIAGMNGSYAICTNNVAGKLVKKLDVVMDDGNTASGSMRVSGSVGGMPIATEKIVNSATYMVCMGV